MSAFLTVAGKLVTLCIYVVIGYIMLNRKIVTEEFCKGISKFLLYITVPCLIIATFQTDYTTERLIQAGQTYGISVVTFGLSILIGIASAKLFRIEKKSATVWAYAVAFPNHAFMGWPVMAAVFGPEAVFFATFANMAFSTYAYTWGVYAMRKTGTHSDEPHSVLGDLITPINISIVIGLILFFTQLRLPESINTAVNGISNLTTPLAMMYVGSILASTKLSELLLDKRVYACSFMRLIFIPVLVLIFGRFLPIDHLVYGVLVIGHAMPVAGYCAIYAGAFGNDVVLASKFVSMTTLLCVITIPIMALFV